MFQPGLHEGAKAEEEGTAGRYRRRGGPPGLHQAGSARAGAAEALPGIRTRPRGTAGVGVLQMPRGGPGRRTAGPGDRAALTVPSMLRSRRGRPHAERLRGAADRGQGLSVKCVSPAAPGERVPRRESPAPAALLRREGGAAAAPAPLPARRGRRGVELLPGTGGCGAHTFPAPAAAPALLPRRRSRKGRTGFRSAVATLFSPAAPAAAATATFFSPHRRPAPPPEPLYYRSPPARHSPPRTHRRPLPPPPPQPRGSRSAPSPPPQPTRAPQRRLPSPLCITPPGRGARRRAPAPPGAGPARAARTWPGPSTARSRQSRVRFRPVPSGAHTDSERAGVHREAMRIPVAMGMREQTGRGSSETRPILQIQNRPRAAIHYPHAFPCAKELVTPGRVKMRVLGLAGYGSVVQCQL